MKTFLTISIYLLSSICLGQKDSICQEESQKLQELTNTEEFNGKLNSIDEKFANSIELGTNIGFSDTLSLVEREVLNNKVGHITNFYKLNGYCTAMQSRSIASDTMVRMSYIYLNKKGKEGKELASQIVKEINEGLDFSEASKKYGKDGYCEIGGDFGWLSINNFLPEISNELRICEVGELKIVETEYVGWYIICKTEEIQYLKYINVTKLVLK